MRHTLDRSAHACARLPPRLQLSLRWWRSDISQPPHRAHVHRDFTVEARPIGLTRHRCLQPALQLCALHLARRFRRRSHDACLLQRAPASPSVGSVRAGSSGDKASTPPASSNVVAPVGTGRTPRDRLRRTARARQTRQKRASLERSMWKDTLLFFSLLGGAPSSRRPHI